MGPDVDDGTVSQLGGRDVPCDVILNGSERIPAVIEERRPQPLPIAPRAAGTRPRWQVVASSGENEAEEFKAAAEKSMAN